MKEEKERREVNKERGIGMTRRRKGKIPPLNPLPPHPKETTKHDVPLLVHVNSRKSKVHTLAVVRL